MLPKRKPYYLRQLASSIFMILALLWLTISIPFVYAAQQKAMAEKSSTAFQGNMQEEEENACNPFGNNTEEKAPSSGVNSLSEEYHAHDQQDLFHAAELMAAHNRCHSASEYNAFHGEMLCPPPNAAC